MNNKLRCISLGLLTLASTIAYSADRRDDLIVNYFENGGAEYAYKILADQSFLSRLVDQFFTCGVKHNLRSLNLMISTSSYDRGLLLVKVAHVDERTKTVFESSSASRSPQTISVGTKTSNEDSQPYRTNFINVHNAELTSLGADPSAIPNIPMVQEPSGEESAFEFGCWFSPKAIEQKGRFLHQSENPMTGPDI